MIFFSFEFTISPPSVSVPNLNFLASTVREILGGPKIPKLGHVTPHDLFLPNFEYFSLKLTAVRLRAKFELSSFNSSRDISWSQNSKIGSRDPHVTLFDPILNFYRSKSPLSVFVPNLNFLASTVREILGSSQNSKIGSRDPHITLPFDPILNFFSLELTAIHLLEKFEVSSFNRSRDIGGPKFQNWVT